MEIENNKLVKYIHPEQQKRRNLFLKELRSGKYKKGTIKSDSKGNPVFDSEIDKDGYCACAVMAHLFGGVKVSLPKAVKALQLTAKDCQYIQTQINDTPDSFDVIADRIEKEIFLK
jgi:hypothetical protein